MWTRKYSILARKYKTATSSQLVDRNKHNINAVMTCYIYAFFAHKTKAGTCLHCTRGKEKISTIEISRVTDHTYTD